MGYRSFFISWSASSNFDGAKRTSRMIALGTLIGRPLVEICTKVSSRLTNVPSSFIAFLYSSRSSSSTGKAYDGTTQCAAINSNALNNLCAT